MIPPKLKDYLISAGAASVSHSGLTLWDHLSGVHRILQACGSHEYVCTAGLFHSIYGTQAFKTATIDISRRSEIQTLIGEQAECLVWAFCTLPRPKLLEVSLQAKRFDWVEELQINTDESQFAQDLTRIECANLLEQRNLSQFPYLAQQAQAMRMLDQEGFSI